MRSKMYHVTFQKRHHDVVFALLDQTLRRRRELPTTETELNAIAAAANSGLSNILKKGYKAPAAMGMPMTL